MLVFNRDLADAVLNSPLSVNSVEGTGASSYANKSAISTGLSLAWGPMTLEYIGLVS